MKSDPVMKSCGKSNDTLSSLHHQIFIKKVATAQAFVNSERLPPTSPATGSHSQRVYFHIMVWVGMANEMNPTEWEWKQENDQLIPIMTQNNVAPDELLKIIHCNCSGDAAADVMDSPAPLHVAHAN